MQSAGEILIYEAAAAQAVQLLPVRTSSTGIRAAAKLVVSATTFVGLQEQTATH